MTPALRARLEQAFQEYGSSLKVQGPGEISIMDFIAGAEAFERLLLEGAGGEFDERAADAEYNRVIRDGEVDHWGVFNWSMYMARWQHSQMSAQVEHFKNLHWQEEHWRIQREQEVAALKAEIEQLKAVLAKVRGGG